MQSREITSLVAVSERFFSELSTVIVHDDDADDDDDETRADCITTCWAHLKHRLVFKKKQKTKNKAIEASTIVSAYGRMSKSPHSGLFYT